MGLTKSLEGINKPSHWAKNILPNCLPSEWLFSSLRIWTETLALSECPACWLTLKVLGLARSIITYVSSLQEIFSLSFWSYWSLSNPPEFLSNLSLFSPIPPPQFLLVLNITHWFCFFREPCLAKTERAGLACRYASRALYKGSEDSWHKLPLWHIFFKKVFK